MKPKFSVKLEKDARFDLAEAYDWYAAKSEFLTNRFLASVQETFKFLEINPLLFKQTYKTFRQAPVKIFPYLLLYQVINEEVIIYRVFHTKRNPKNKYKD
jgi:toxin ParE1/3/4